MMRQLAAGLCMACGVQSHRAARAGKGGTGVLVRPGHGTSRRSALPLFYAPGLSLRHAVRQPAPAVHRACAPHGPRLASPSTVALLPTRLRSGAQRAVYEAVLDVHRACLDVCRPGATLRQLHHLSVRLLSDAIAQVGPRRPCAAVVACPCLPGFPFQAPPPSEPCSSALLCDPRNLPPLPASCS